MNNLESAQVILIWKNGPDGGTTSFLPSGFFDGATEQ